MRILQICSAHSIGGGERHVIDLSSSLTQRGHDVFAAVGPGSPVAARLSALPRENIGVFRLRNALDVRSAIAIGKFARENKIEMISAHIAKDYPIAALAARRAGVPFTITRHVLFPMNRLHRTLLRNVSYVIAPSNAVADNLRRERVFPQEKIITIRHGLDIERFPEPVRTHHDSMVVGTIGNLDPVKGFDILIHAAKSVADTMPDVEFKIVGEDRSRRHHNEKGLRDLIARLDIQDSVTIAELSDDIQSTLAGFDLFVSASRSESFGLVIAEAMLSGIPVIATATEGAKEIISDPSLGQLVPIGSAQALAEGIAALLRNPNKREQFAISGRANVLKNFSLHRMVDETEALYHRVLDSK